MTLSPSSPDGGPSAPSDACWSLVGRPRVTYQDRMTRILTIAVVVFGLRTASADTFTVRLDSDTAVRVHARHAGSGQNAHALEFADGQLQVIPADRLIERVAGPDPTPVTFEAMLQQLADEFGADRIVSQVEKPFVITLVRASNGALEPLVQRRLDAVLKKAGSFFKGMQASFLEFVRQARVETTPIKYPLVAVIFESDRQFDAYTVSITGQQGLSPENIAAFYDLLSNRLVIRFRECNTFDTPLHEAVHQQVYNRGILQRLAPVPAWFNEGIATGFEGDGERIRGGPRVISDRYGPMSLKARVVDWREIVANDRTFQGDVLAAEAYGHAWGMHWLLVTKYRSEYNKLVRHFAAKKPLELDRPDQRVEEFEQLLGKSVQELQAEFYRDLPRALARRRP
uniref:DUF1570 domain-containing protein n=1 Tax=Schlesneria paludicola TaxID=360056 RepID=A0A7C2K1L5_9PLAN